MESGDSVSFFGCIYGKPAGSVFTTNAMLLFRITTKIQSSKDEVKYVIFFLEKTVVVVFSV